MMSYGPQVSPTGQMATFHPFPRLPPELRAQIWKMTVTPRVVDVRILYKFCATYSDYLLRQSLVLPHLSSLTPVPAILQTCREARFQGLYQKAFSELDTPNSVEPRYIWTRFEVDTIHIGASTLSDFTSVAPLIQRLKFEAENSDENFLQHESRALSNFVNAKEIYVVCSDGLRAWHHTSEDCHWACGKDNLFFIDPYEGIMMRSIEMDAMFDEMVEDEYAQDQVYVES
ncbi:hypothetical protein NUW58_g414 [Xylaria curta]|uniref:Uncharacterized protein n=1 Tax=Xylaria curta TaxID=42375 RepID=A0ACC1PR45_9PEZI|nr:hypothetical protein NUW58_g414 [Xylaria curta]